MSWMKVKAVTNWLIKSAEPRLIEIIDPHPRQKSEISTNSLIFCGFFALAFSGLIMTFTWVLWYRFYTINWMYTHLKIFYARDPAAACLKLKPFQFQLQMLIFWEDAHEKEDWLGNIGPILNLNSDNFHLSHSKWKSNKISDQAYFPRRSGKLYFSPLLSSNIFSRSTAASTSSLVSNCPRQHQLSTLVDPPTRVGLNSMRQDDRLRKEWEVLLLLLLLSWPNVSCWNIVIMN